MSALLELERVTRRYPGAASPSVAEITLGLEAGETIAIVGPSGCGKSTTLRMVAGLESVDSGRVLISGRDVTRIAPAERDVAMVFQGFALYPHLSAAENIAFPLRMKGVRGPEREARVAAVARMLELDGLLERLPDQLSGGERQRVAMGRAIVRRPRAFLFDEPLSNLDAALRHELRVELRRLLDRLEASALYVTHDQVEAMTIGHRVCVLRAGAVQQLATPREIYEAPANRFVAEFVGLPKINLFDVALAGSGPGFGDGPLPPHLHPPASVGGKCTLGVRPEQLDLVASEGAVLGGQVTLVEPLGSRAHVELLTSEGPVRVETSGSQTPRMGEPVGLGFDRVAPLWFDSGTGARL